MKSPPKQMRDSVACELCDAFIRDMGTGGGGLGRMGQSLTGRIAGIPLENP